jgi:hypothetical protein
MSIKMGIKNYLIADSFIFRHKKWITLKNEADPSFDSKVQREKKDIPRNPKFVLWKQILQTISNDKN